MSFALKTYKILTQLTAPLLPLWLKMRVAKGKEDNKRISERFGIASIPKPHTDIIWFHGASVGETKMLLPLIDRILAFDKNICVLVTSGTLTSAELLAKSLPKGALHQFYPADTPKAVERFLAHWQPKIAIFVESEIWPNMILAAKQYGVKLALINARMSDKSLARWQGFGKKMAQEIFGAFTLITAANTKTANILSQVLQKNIENIGNLKNSSPPLVFDQSKLDKLQKSLANRKIWCAASTHKGEEKLLLGVVKTIKQKYKNQLVIIAPRHPERADEVADLCTNAGFDIIRYTSGDMPNKNTDIWLMDKMGEMGLVYKLSDIAFVGGSLLPQLKGHNPLEPAQLDCVIISGNNVESFGEIYRELQNAEAVIMVKNAADLTKNLTSLFDNPAKMQKLAQSAKQTITDREENMEKLWAELKPLLEQAIS